MSVCLQLKRYYEPEPDLLPPVKLEPCITAHGDQVFLQEPLVILVYTAACMWLFAPAVLTMSVINSGVFLSPQAHLVSCTVHCLLWLQNMRRSANRGANDSDEEEEEEEGYQSELQTILESVTRRMIKCEMEDFELVCMFFLFFKKSVFNRAGARFLSWSALITFH